MAQNTSGYGVASYGYGEDTGYTGYGGYGAPQPPIPSGYGNDNSYANNYSNFTTNYNQPAPTYQQTGSYGAIGEPVKPAYDTGQFASPPPDPAWQGYGDHGGNPSDGSNQYNTQGGYDSYSQEDTSTRYAPELSNTRGGGPMSRGNWGRGRAQRGRGGFDATDGFSGRGGRGAMRGRGRGQYNDSSSGQYGDGMGGGLPDGGSIGRGGYNRGRGQFDRGRGRGQFDCGRGRGQFDRGRGGGQFESRNRGRGQLEGGNRGKGQFGDANRGTGRGGSNRGGFAGGENMGRGQFDISRGQNLGVVRGRGQFDGGSRGRGGVRGRGQSDRGRGQVGGTSGRGWVSGGLQVPGQDSLRPSQDMARGRGQRGGRGDGQSANRGRGQDGVGGVQRGGLRGRGQQDGTTRGQGQPNRGRGRGDDSTPALPGVKATKPFKMSSPDAQGFISYKNNLQEYAQKDHKPVPQYACQKADIGYTATVTVDGMMFTCSQSQREKKDAEQSAAFEALKSLGFIDSNEMFTPKLGTGKGKKRASQEGDSPAPNAKLLKQEQPEQAPPPLPSQSFKSKLNEAVMKNKMGLPNYSTIRTAGGFLSTLILNGQVYQGIKAYGTKKLAEQHVAEIVYNQLDFQSGAAPAEVRIASDDSNAVLSTSESDIEPAAITSPAPKPPSAPKAKPMKNIVQEHCQKNGMQIPIYNTVKESGMFIATVTVNGVEYVGTPHIMKKTAEQNAAKKVIEQLGLK